MTTGVKASLSQKGSLIIFQRFDCSTALSKRLRRERSILQVTISVCLAWPFTGCKLIMTPDQPFSGKKRYLSNRSPGNDSAWIDAAKAYVGNLTDQERDSLYAKPYLQDAANATFFPLMYDIMNLLKTMSIPPGGKILEVGSGPGWITEILMCLGFEVDALEPGAD